MKRIIPLTLLTVILGTSMGYGWGSKGHQITADIAWSYLQPQTRQAIQEVLGEESLAEASLWPDRQGRRPPWNWTSPFHYMNVAKGSKEVTWSDCANQGCVISAIRRYSEDL